jgi:hypothetical protein
MGKEVGGSEEAGLRRPVAPPRARGSGPWACKAHPAYGFWGMEHTGPGYLRTMTFEWKEPSGNETTQK